MSLMRALGETWSITVFDGLTVFARRSPSTQQLLYLHMCSDCGKRLALTYATTKNLYNGALNGRCWSCSGRISLVIKGGEALLPDEAVVKRFI